MVQPGDYADVLRALGRFLDARQATEIAVVDQGRSILKVSWQEGQLPRQERVFHWVQLEQWRTAARAQRQRDEPAPPMGNAEVLRVLGAECVRLGLQGARITQRGTSFHLTGWCAEQRV